MYEDCIGLYATDKTNASQLTVLIKDVLMRSNLPLNNCRGQCYDGAANMSGRRSGVATQILQEEPRALYLHCMAHCLNLAVQDSCRTIKIMSDSFDTVLELSKIFKYSAKKKAMLLKLKSELSPESPGLRPLCPTRWTVRAASMKSVIENYHVIISVLEEIIEEYRGNTEATSSARGVLATIEKFAFLFGIVVAEKFFFCHRYASVTLSKLKEFRTDEQFSNFWDELQEKIKELGVSEPELPRKRRVPARYDENAATTYFDHSPRSMYHRYYFEVLDKLTGEIECRLQSSTFNFYAKVEIVMKNAATGEQVPDHLLREVLDHFKEDLQEHELRTELSLLKNVMEGTTFTINNLKEKIVLFHGILPQVCKLLRLLLIMPATSATSERSFSSLRHVKSYLRTTMKQDRLNHLMMLYIHKERKIDYDEAMKEFICNQERIQTFGK